MLLWTLDRMQQESREPQPGGMWRVRSSREYVRAEKRTALNFMKYRSKGMYEKRTMLALVGHRDVLSNMLDTRCGNCLLRLSYFDGW